MSKVWCCADMSQFCVHTNPSARHHLRHVHTLRHNRSRASAASGDASEDAQEYQSNVNSLSVTVKRKQKQLADLLQDMGMEALEDRLQSATASPANPAHRFAQLIQVTGDCQ